MWTDKGVVYAKPSGGGLLEGPAFKIEKAHTTLGAYQKGDDASFLTLNPPVTLSASCNVPDMCCSAQPTGCWRRASLIA